MDYENDALDGVLFRFWIRMAANRPSKIAVALARCLTPADYRKALVELAQAEKINLPL